MSDILPFVAASFDPSGSILAYAFQALDGFRLRVSHVLGDVPDVEYAADKGVKITALTWVSGVSKQLQQQKKRKRVANVQDISSLAVAIGTNVGTVLLYSPASNQLVSTLGSAPNPAITGLSVKSGNLLVLQKGGLISEWDLIKGSSVNSSESTLDDLNLIESADSGVLVSSTAPYFIKQGDADPSISYPGFASPIRQLVVDPAGEGFAAIAEDDRQIQCFSLAKPKPVNSFMAPSNVTHLSISADSSILAAVAEDGNVYLFNQPFVATASTPTPKQRKKSINIVKPVLTIHISRPTGETVSVLRSFFQDDFLTLAWGEQGTVASFERVQWRNNGKLVEEDISLVKEKVAPKINDHLSNGHDPAAAPVYKEGQVTVGSGENFADLDSEDDEEEETLADRLNALEVDELSSEEDLASDLDDGDNEDRKKTKGRKNDKLKLAVPGSFAVLLAQALTTDDKQLLEQCFAERDETMIKTSIIRLEPGLAAKLLEKLAERMARVQQRAGQLSDWTKWVIIVHGGYLVTVPNLLKSLASLHTTLASRVATLPRLRTLQGRLELLNSQIDIRQEILASRREIEDDTEDVAEFVYNDEVIVNGEEDFDNADDFESGEELDEMEIDEIDDDDLEEFSEGEFDEDEEEDDE